MWQDSKQCLNGCKMEESHKTGKWGVLQLKRSWGPACPICLLRKVGGGCCIMLNPHHFHMSAPQVWPGMLRAKRELALLRRKIKQSWLEFRAWPSGQGVVGLLQGVSSQSQERWTQFEWEREREGKSERESEREMSSRGYRSCIMGWIMRHRWCRENRMVRSKDI